MPPQVISIAREENSTEIFPWNPYFEVGYNAIDVQHQVLVGMINEICWCAIDSKNSEEVLHSLFGQLISYTQTHFEYEEQFFASHHVPPHLIKNHAKYHSDLILNIDDLHTKYDAETHSISNLEDILSTLVTWLTNHILGEDMLLCAIAEGLDSGLDASEAEFSARQAMNGTKGAIADVFRSMTHVWTASVLELRREINYRMDLEKQLSDEIKVRKRSERNLQYLAEHDSLTNLPNRMLFIELSNTALNLAKRQSNQQSIFFIDIDGFKSVNDSFGHDSGDALLGQIAKRLKSNIRMADIPARLGGDEFVIHLVGDSDATDTEVVAEKIIQALRLPFLLDVNEVEISASVGIAQFPKDGETLEELLSCADRAMYAAKKAGKNRFRFFEIEK